MLLRCEWCNRIFEGTENDHLCVDCSAAYEYHLSEQEWMDGHCQACGTECTDDFCATCSAEINRIEEYRQERDQEAIMIAMDNRRYE